MNRLKTFAKYAIWIILFWIFSDFFINMAIMTTYKSIDLVGDKPNGIIISQMQATSVNGRAKILVNDSGLSGKYIKLDLYSDIDNHLGTQYIEIGNVAPGETKEIDTYFKISQVKKYGVSIQDTAGESTEGFMDTAMSAITIFISAINLLFVL